MGSAMELQNHILGNRQNGSGSALELQNPTFRYNWNPTSADICMLIVCKSASGTALELKNISYLCNCKLRSYAKTFFLHTELRDDFFGGTCSREK